MFSDPSERVHSIWLAERAALSKARREAGFFQECTIRYPVIKKLRIPLRESHRVIWVSVDPRTQGSCSIMRSANNCFAIGIGSAELISTAEGHPSCRTRVLSTGLSNEMLLWCGPQTDDEIQTDFDKYFGRILLLTGTVYYQAKEEEVDAMWDGMAFTRQCHDSFTDPMARMRGLLPSGTAF